MVGIYEIMQHLVLRNVFSRASTIDVSIHAFYLLQDIPMLHALHTCLVVRRAVKSFTVSVIYLILSAISPSSMSIDSLILFLSLISYVSINSVKYSLHLSHYFLSAVINFKFFSFILFPNLFHHSCFAMFTVNFVFIQNLQENKILLIRPTWLYLPDLYANTNLNKYMKVLLIQKLYLT